MLLAGILLALSAPARAQTITAEPQTVIDLGSGNPRLESIPK